MIVLDGARVITPNGVLVNGYVKIVGDRIVEVGTGTPPDAPAQAPATPAQATAAPAQAPAAPAQAPAAWLAPGFVDMHNHGGGGHTFTTGDPDAARGAVEFHLAHGTTSMVASLVSSPHELMMAATRAYRRLVAEGVLAGIHYEGPYLAGARCGAQNLIHLRPPSTVEISALLDTGDGAVRMVTLAPELPGALAAIRLLTSHGVVAAVGHTDATYDQTLAAIEAGASVGTHVFNGMRPIHHREPGPILALLSAEPVTCELVADGVHLHDAALQLAATVAGPGRIALITDAMAAAGAGTGTYELGGQTIEVADGVARLTRNGSIAGSTLTMDSALRHAVHAGLSVVDAVRAASTTPAKALGLHDVGALTPGRRADIVALDEHLNVQRVMRAGVWTT